VNRSIEKPHPALAGLTLAMGVVTVMVGLAVDSSWVIVLGLISGVTVLWMDE